MANKQGKMAGLINYRMRVTLNDGRQMVGQMLAFDKHMNLVLADTEEFRRVKRKAAKSTAPGAASSSAPLVESEEKRTLGLTIVRGAHIISLSVESPPPADPAARLGASAPGGMSTTLAAGAGIARPAGRGAPIGLAVRSYLWCFQRLWLILDRALLVWVHQEDLVVQVSLELLDLDEQHHHPALEALSHLQVSPQEEHHHQDLLLQEGNEAWIRIMRG